MQFNYIEFIKKWWSNSQNQDLEILMTGLVSNTLHFRLGNPDLKPEESDNAL